MCTRPMGDNRASEVFAVLGILAAIAAAMFGVIYFLLLINS